MKNINLFLMDDDLYGRIKCSIFGWTGVVFKMYMNGLERWRGRRELKQSGIYLLFGSDDTGETENVYIGQACIRKDGRALLQRIGEHVGEELNWREAIAITTVNDTLGLTDLAYLEHNLHALAKKIGRSVVKNDNDPTRGNVTEEKESDLQSFLYNSITVITALGYRTFAPTQMNESSTEHHDSNNVYYVTSGERGTANAVCINTEDGYYIVTKGSHICTEPTPSCPEKVKRVRCNHEKVIENGVLKQDIPFPTPGEAAQFVLFASVDGWTKLKNRGGKTLKDVKREQQAAMSEL